MKLNKLWPIATLALVLYGCYPVDSVTYEDLDIAGTIYDKDYYTPGGENKFNDLKTFALVDTIIYLDENEDRTDKPDHSSDDYVLQQVKSNMLKCGFDEITDTAIDPDVLVTITAFTSEFTYYYWYPYWGWYYGGYYPYYKSNKNNTATKSAAEETYYYYPWYPYYGGGYYETYETGTVLIEMVDFKNLDLTIDPDDEVRIPAVWMGAISGLLGSTVSNQKARIASNIEQCFNQSPYLFK